MTARRNILLNGSDGAPERLHWAGVAPE
jgi:hypothetical protein